MLGTGEFASSASESTIPSCTSSSWRSGTYCRQIGSPGDLMRSTMAGEMRNSKFSAAWRRRPRSGKCSGPNRATRASSEARLWLRSRSCQDAIHQVLPVDHQVVGRSVIPPEPSRLRVPAPLVEAAGRRVVGARRRLDDNQPTAVGDQRLLDRGEEPRADALPLPGRIDDDPVQVVGALCSRGGPPAGVAHEVLARVRTQESVIVVPGEVIVEQLDRERDLLGAEETRRPGEPFKRCALRADRKSTRLNSSHANISYAVFCLKKKNK